MLGKFSIARKIGILNSRELNYSSAFSFRFTRPLEYRIVQLTPPSNACHRVTDIYRKNLCVKLINGHICSCAVSFLSMNVYIASTNQY